MSVLKNWWLARQERKRIKNLDNQRLLHEISNLEMRVRMLERARNREAAAALKTLPVGGYSPEPAFDNPVCGV